MAERERYRRRERTLITAVRLDLETSGFSYEKWGGVQRCKQGDWLVDNGGDVYTIDADVFAETYRPVSPGRFEKRGFVWAERAAHQGTIETKEGSTDYATGDFLVFNDPTGQDGYAMSAETFQRLYEPAGDRQRDEGTS